MKICDILERRTQIFTLFNTNFRASDLNPFGIAAMCWKAVTLFTGLCFSGWANEKWDFHPDNVPVVVWSLCFFCFLTSYQCLLPIAAHIFLEWSVKAKQGRGLEKSLWSQSAAEPLSSCHFQPVVWRNICHSFIMCGMLGLQGWHKEGSQNTFPLTFFLLGPTLSALACGGPSVRCVESMGRCYACQSHKQYLFCKIWRYLKRNGWRRGV